jgi:hypothetical protein
MEQGSYINTPKVNRDVCGVKRKFQPEQKSGDLVQHKIRYKQKTE